MQLDWEIWLDANISPIIAKWMQEFTGFTVRSAYILALINANDLEIYQKAKAHGKVILLSKDADFPELISRLGAPPKLINLKLPNCDNKTLWEYIQPHIIDIVELLSTTDIDIVELD